MPVYKEAHNISHKSALFKPIIVKEIQKKKDSSYETACEGMMAHVSVVGSYYFFYFLIFSE